MILHYSSLQHIKIFGNNGFLKEHTLLLNIINKSSISKFLEIIKILKKGLFNILKLKINLLSPYINFVNDFKLLDEIKSFENIKSKIFIMKKFYFLYFQNFFSFLAETKSLTEIKIILRPLFLKFNSFLPKNKYFSKDKYLIPIKLRLNFKQLTKSETRFCEYNSFIFKNKVTKYVNNLYEREIFVAGNSCDYYQGNITPFYKSQMNWLVSTGLKTDIECYQPKGRRKRLHKDWKSFKKEDDQYEDMYESYFFVKKAMFKRIVFKVYNFNKKIKYSFKRAARHLFLCRYVNYFGRQHYINESKTTFNFKQIYTSYNLLLFNLNIYTLNKNFILMNFLCETKFNYNFSFVKNIFQAKFIRLINSNNKFTLEMKLVFVLFKSLNFNLNYYNSLYKDIFEVLDKSGTFYGHLVSFLRIQQTYDDILKNLISNNILYISKVYFKLTNLNKLIEFKYLKNKENDLKFFLFIFKIFLLNLKFFKLFKKSIVKSFYLNECFDSFIDYNKKDFLNRKVITDEEINSIELLSCYKKISFLKTYDIYKLYFFFYYYIQFLIEWKVNMNLILFSKYKGNLILQEILVSRIDKRFEKLEELFETLMYTHVKKFYLNFILILLDLIDAFKDLFYSLGSFYIKKMNFETYFCFSNLFIYLNKWIDSYSLNHNLFEEDSKFDGILTLTSLINFSDLFLGKWFFNRQLNKFFDSSYNYSNIFSLTTGSKFTFSQLLKKKVKVKNFLYLFKKILLSNLKKKSYLRRSVSYDFLIMLGELNFHFLMNVAEGQKQVKHPSFLLLENNYSRSVKKKYQHLKRFYPITTFFRYKGRRHHIKNPFKKRRKQRRNFYYNFGKYQNYSKFKPKPKSKTQKKLEALLPFKTFSKKLKKNYSKGYKATGHYIKNCVKKRKKFKKLLFTLYAKSNKSKNTNKDFNLDELLRNNHLNFVFKKFSRNSLFKTKLVESFDNNFKNFKYASKDLFKRLYLSKIKYRYLTFLETHKDKAFNYCQEDFDFNFVINRLFFVDMFLILYRNKTSKKIYSTYYNFWYNK